MGEKAHLQLFHAPSTEAPQRFFELRRFRNQVWSAQGAVHTWGAQALAVCETHEEAEHLAAAHSKDIEAQGFMLTRSITYSPDGFDYAAFTAEVTSGVERYWRTLKTSAPAIAFDRLAIMTDSDVMTVGCCANAGSPHDSDETLHIPSEWKHGEMHELDIAYRLLLSKHRDIPFETAPPHHADNVLECMVRAIETLRETSVIDASVLLAVIISDDDQIPGMFERLNAQGAAAAFEAFYGPSDRQFTISI